MAKYKYRVKSVDGNPLLPDGSVLPGIGIVQNGSIESDTPIENPNFELAGETPAPAHLEGVVHQNEQPVQPTTESEQN